jgi:hypothetical protein
MIADGIVGATVPSTATQAPAAAFGLVSPSTCLSSTTRVATSTRTQAPTKCHRSAARSLIARLRSIDDAPDEVGLEFGVQLSAQTGAFIASVAAEANFKVSMTWRRRAAET